MTIIYRAVGGSENPDGPSGNVVGGHHQATWLLKR